MKNLIMHIRNEKEVNCIGYFNSSFFNLEELLQLQKDIRNLIKDKEKIGDDAKKQIKWYDVTEHMRVKLLTNN